LIFQAFCPVDSPRKRAVTVFVMSLGRVALSMIAWILMVSVPVMANPQETNGEQRQQGDAASLQKKATQAEAQIHANKDDRDQLMRAIKTNERPLAKEVLLRNGFTTQDLENAKITLRTGGSKRGENEIEISALCCDPKEIIIQRSLDYFTK